MRRYPSYAGLILFLLPCLPAQGPVPASNPNPKAVIDGEVLNAATNAPIPGARVKLEQYPAEPLYTKADDQGHFRFADLTPGMYGLRVESPGFLRFDQYSVDLTMPRAGTAVRRVVSPPTGASNANFTRSTDPDGALHAKATVSLTAQAVIVGQVTDPYGLPMADCQVELLVPRPASSAGVTFGPFGNSEVMSRMSINVDDKGDFRFGGLGPGKYYVAANKNGGSQTWQADYRNTYYPGAISLASAKLLELAAGQQVRADIRIARQGGVRVAGRIVAPQTESAASDTVLYTNVSLAPENSPLPNAAASFSGGRDQFELNQVLPGKYTLMAAAYRPSASMTPGLPRAESGLVREIQVGEHDMLDVDITLQPLRDLPGVVTFHEGCQPFPVEIRVSTYGPLGGSAKARPGPDGKFVLSGLTPGRSRVNVMNGPNSYVVSSVESMRLGERDVQKDGMDIPYSGSDSLNIVVDCNPRRSR
jgi:hypothetical protein